MRFGIRRIGRLAVAALFPQHSPLLHRSALLWTNRKHGHRVRPTFQPSVAMASESMEQVCSGQPYFYGRRLRWWTTASGAQIRCIGFCRSYHWWEASKPILRGVSSMFRYARRWLCALQHRRCEKGVLPSIFPVCSIVRVVRERIRISLSPGDEQSPIRPPPSIRGVKGTRPRHLHAGCGDAMFDSAVRFPETRHPICRSRGNMLRLGRSR